MAYLLTKITTILFLAIMLLLHSQMAFSSENIDIHNDSDSDSVSVDEDGDEEYVLDSPVPSPGRSRSDRLLASVIKKGTRCDATRPRYNVCNGVAANKGKSLLYCCKKHCRNVLGDRNNCGRCGRKCGFGQRCCGGRCTAVLFSPNHCGKCERRCKRGVACENGVCGYA